MKANATKPKENESNTSEGNESEGEKEEDANSTEEPEVVLKQKKKKHEKKLSLKRSDYRPKSLTEESIEAPGSQIAKKTLDWHLRGSKRSSRL